MLPFLAFFYLDKSLNFLIVSRFLWLSLVRNSPSALKTVLSIVDSILIQSESSGFNKSEPKVLLTQKGPDKLSMTTEVSCLLCCLIA